jgi:hypothetical protein
LSRPEKSASAAINSAIRGRRRLTKPEGYRPYLTIGPVAPTLSFESHPQASVTTARRGGWSPQAC